MQDTVNQANGQYSMVSLSTRKKEKGLNKNPIKYYNKCKKSEENDKDRR